MEQKGRATGRFRRFGQATAVRPLLNLTILLFALLLPSLSHAVLVSALLPTSRSAVVGTTVTAFATIINAGELATDCSIAPTTPVAADFFYQITDPATNALTGTPDTPVDMAAGAVQSFVIGFTPTAPFASTDVAFAFDCTNTDPAASTVGLNTLLLSSSTTGVPDIVALAATTSGDGVVELARKSGAGAFAVATVNVGTTASINASIDTGATDLPVTLLLCETNPTTGACISDLGSEVDTQISANATPTFAIFPTSMEPVAFDPGNKRVFVRFRDDNGEVRGATSVAVKTLKVDVQFAGGGGIALREGSLPDETEIVVHDAEPPLLPEGLAAVGPAIHIASDVAPSVPVTIRMPIPTGTNPDQLVITRVEADGTVTVLMPEIDGNELVANTPAFSTFSPAILDEVSGPGTRIPRLGIRGQPALAFSENGFYDLGRELLENRVPDFALKDTRWSVSGDAGLTDSRLRSVRVTAPHTETEVVLSVWWTESYSGLVFYTAFDIQILEKRPAGDWRLFVFPDKLSLRLPEDAILGGFALTGELEEGPIRWRRDFGDGSGPIQSQSPIAKSGDSPLGIGKLDLLNEYRKSGIFRLTVTAENLFDESSETTAMQVIVRGGLDAFLFLPDEGVGNSLAVTFPIEIQGGIPPYTVSGSVQPASSASVTYYDVDEIVVAFDEPGSYRIDAVVTDSQNDETRPRLAATVPGEFPLHMSFVAAPPEESPVGEEILTTVRVIGGTRVVGGGKRGYDLDIDWGDGKTETLTDVGIASAYDDGAMVDIPHTYTASADEPYPVTIHATDATGERASLTADIRVAEECAIDYFISFGNDTIELSGTDPAFPFITWSGGQAEGIFVEDDVARGLYHLVGVDGLIPQTIQYGDYSQPGTKRGDFAFFEEAPPLELNRLYEIDMDAVEGPGEIVGVIITGTTCE